jgi:hypothetical protein
MKKRRLLISFILRRTELNESERINPLFCPDEPLGLINRIRKFLPVSRSVPSVVCTLQQIFPSKKLVTGLPSPRRAALGFTLSFPGRIDNTLKSKCLVVRKTDADRASRQSSLGITRPRAGVLPLANYQLTLP